MKRQKLVGLVALCCTVVANPTCGECKRCSSSNETWSKDCLCSAASEGQFNRTCSQLQVELSDDTPCPNATDGNYDKCRDDDGYCCQPSTQTCGWWNKTNDCPNNTQLIGDYDPLPSVTKYNITNETACCVQIQQTCSEWIPTTEYCKPEDDHTQYPNRTCDVVCAGEEDAQQCCPLNKKCTDGFKDKEFECDQCLKTTKYCTNDQNCTTKDKKRCCGPCPNCGSRVECNNFLRPQYVDPTKECGQDPCQTSEPQCCTNRAKCTEWVIKTPCQPGSSVRWLEYCKTSASSCNQESCCETNPTPSPVTPTVPPPPTPPTAPPTAPPTTRAPTAPTIPPPNTPADAATGMIAAIFPIFWMPLVLGLLLRKSSSSVDDFATETLGWAQGSRLPWGKYVLLCAVCAVPIAAGATVVAMDDDGSLIPEAWESGVIYGLALGWPSALLLGAAVACCWKNAVLRTLVAGTLYWTAASRLRGVWAGAVVVWLCALTILVGVALHVETTQLTAAIVCDCLGAVGLLGYAALADKNGPYPPWFAPLNVWVWGERGAAPLVVEEKVGFRFQTVHKRRV